MLRNVFQKARLKIILGVFKYRRGFDRTILKEIDIVSADDGRCTAIFTANRNNCDEDGHLANGFATAIVDSITSFGLSTALYAKGHVSVIINIRYFQSIGLGDEITIRTEVLGIDRKMAFLAANLKNNRTGEVVAKGTQVKFLTGLILFE